jgi:sugar phosphate isomerase/epimerase
VLEAAAGAGFRGVALDWFTLRAAERAGTDASTVAERVRDLDLVVTDLSALGLGAGREHRRAGVDVDGRRCAALGIPLCALVLTVPPSPALDERVSPASPTSSRPAGAAGPGVRAYTQVRTLAEARAVCEAVGYDRIGVLVDTWHLTRSGGSPADIADLAPSELACVQVADAAPRAGYDLPDESRRSRLLPGEGTVDFVAVAAALTTAGYDGPLGTEVLSRDSPAGRPRRWRRRASGRARLLPG